MYGTGPYKLTDYQAGTFLALERFGGYWGEKAKNKKVIFSYFNDASAETNALASGQIDIITDIDNPEQLKAFKGNPAYSIAEGRSMTKQVLAFNDKRKPFMDPKARRAISSAIDKAALLKAAWDGYGQLIGSFVLPQDPLVRYRLQEQKLRRHAPGARERPRPHLVRQPQLLLGLR
jgi:peptide/nickel transport system substrate-binding protein